MAEAGADPTLGTAGTEGLSPPRHRRPPASSASRWATGRHDASARLDGTQAAPRSTPSSRPSYADRDASQDEEASRWGGLTTTFLGGSSRGDRSPVRGSPNVISCTASYIISVLAFAARLQSGGVPCVPHGPPQGKYDLLRAIKLLNSCPSANMINIVEGRSYGGSTALLQYLCPSSRSEATPERVCAVMNYLANAPTSFIAELGAWCDALWHRPIEAKRNPEFALFERIGGVREPAGGTYVAIEDYCGKYYMLVSFLFGCPGGARSPWIQRGDQSVFRPSLWQIDRSSTRFPSHSLSYFKAVAKERSRLRTPVAVPA